jgi:hypothetical protein
MTETTKKYRDGLKELTQEALGATMSISVSETDFGVSMYLQDENIKMRFSDHSVGHKRFSEDRWSLNSILESPTNVINAIRENFSDDYTSLNVNDDNGYFPVARIKKSEINDWEQVVVEGKKIINMPILLTEIEDKEIIKIGELTKKGNKRHCQFWAKKFNRGVRNSKTEQIITRHCPVSPKCGLPVHKEN